MQSIPNETLKNLMVILMMIPGQEDLKKLSTKSSINNKSKIVLFKHEILIEVKEILKYF